MFDEIHRIPTDKELLLQIRDKFGYIIFFLEDWYAFNNTDNPEIYFIPFRNIVAGVILVMTSSTTILDIAF